MVFKKGQIAWNKEKKDIYSKETLKKMGDSHKGCIAWNKGLTKETDERVRKYGEKQKGKKLSKETKRKLSEAHKGKKLSKATKKKMSEAGKGKLKSENHRKNISKGRKGLRHSKKTLKKQSEVKIGKRNPNWNNGSSFEPYDRNFNRRFKKFIRDRDNNICLLCNIGRKKLKKALCVHHIDYDKLNTIKENCISLCNSCHGRTTTNRKLWTIFFQSLLKEKYGYED